jgi:hypothetical protein
MKESEFLKQFEDLSLPASEFNHRGHLWLGWLYIRDHELGLASQKLSQGIKAFAESLGATGKFHYTLTATFACAIKSRFKQDQSFEDFLKQNEDLQSNPMSIIETHFSPQKLKTQEARTKMVYPDREPFPKEYEKQLFGFNQGE